MTKNKRQKIIQIFAVLAIIAMLLSSGGGLLFYLF